MKREYIKTEFKDFKPPEGFSGGCIKSALAGFCAHLKPDGKIGKIEENCINYEKCKGYNYRYNA